MNASMPRVIFISNFVTIDITMALIHGKGTQCPCCKWSERQVGDPEYNSGRKSTEKVQIIGVYSGPLLFLFCNF